MPENNLTPIKAIRAKCLDCVCNQPSEVKLCENRRCQLWPFRMGKNPRAKRNLTDEQRQKLSERMDKARQEKERRKEEKKQDE